MNVVVIPAKGNSNRLPNKNMLLINGRPMIDYSIADAKASQHVSAVYVSTDSNEIESHAYTMGVNVIRRPRNLGGETPIIDVYRHALSSIDDPLIDVVVGLQPDHPDRNVSISEALAIFDQERADHLISKDANGTKNGAHYILRRSFLERGVSRKTVSIVDDCTNIHYKEDLERAAARLAARMGS